MVEILVVIGVLCVGLLAISAAVIYGLKAEQHGAPLTEAANHGENLVNRIRLQNIPFTAPINDAPTARVPLNAAPFTAFFPAGTPYTRSIQMQQLSLDPNNYQYDLSRVTVTLYWQERAGEQSLQLLSVHRRP
jgi:hypothetical protein